MSDRKLKYLFNPLQKEPQQLKAEFVVRTAVFNQLFEEIQEDLMQHPPQHYMILGQRGMGKTTLLLHLKYAVLEDEKLNKWLLPVLFNEEQYSMPDLAAFFEHIPQDSRRDGRVLWGTGRKERLCQSLTGAGGSLPSCPLGP